MRSWPIVRVTQMHLIWMYVSARERTGRGESGVTVGGGHPLENITV